MKKKWRHEVSEHVSTLICKIKVTVQIIQSYKVSGWRLLLTDFSIKSAINLYI